MARSLIDLGYGFYNLETVTRFFHNQRETQGDSSWTLWIGGTTIGVSEKDAPAAYEFVTKWVKRKLVSLEAQPRDARGRFQER